jgi:hypothetical protein
VRASVPWVRIPPSPPVSDLPTRPVEPRDSPGYPGFFGAATVSPPPVVAKPAPIFGRSLCWPNSRSRSAHGAVRFPGKREKYREYPLAVASLLAIKGEKPALFLAPHTSCRNRNREKLSRVTGIAVAVVPGTVLLSRPRQGTRILRETDRLTRLPAVLPHR